MPRLVSHEGTVLILHCFFPNVEWIKFPVDYTVHKRRINTCSVQYHHCRSLVFRMPSYKRVSGGAGWDATGAGAIVDPITWAEVDAPTVVLALPLVQGIIEPGGDTVGAQLLFSAVETGPPVLCTVRARPIAVLMRGVGSRGGNW
jgi:hypothetical protein